MADPNDIFNIDKQKSVMEGYDRDIRSKYKILFRDGVGREVLGDILSLCEFPGSAGEAYHGLDPNNPTEIGRFNVGLDIAERAGVLKAIGTHILGITRDIKEV